MVHKVYTAKISCSYQLFYGSGLIFFCSVNGAYDRHASVTEMHDYVVGANFATAPRLKEKFFGFALDVLRLYYSPLLPWEFICAKLRNLTISPTWLGGEIC